MEEFQGQIQALEIMVGAEEDKGRGRLSFGEQATRGAVNLEAHSVSDMGAVGQWKDDGDVGWEMTRWARREADTAH